MKWEAVVQGVDENDPVISPSTTPIPARAVDRCEDACLTITNILKPPRISRRVEGLLTSAKSSLCGEGVVGMARALGDVDLTLGTCPPLIYADQVKKAQHDIQDAIIYCIFDGVDGEFHNDKRSVSHRVENWCNALFDTPASPEVLSRLLNSHYQIFKRPQENIRPKRKGDWHRQRSFSRPPWTAHGRDTDGPVRPSSAEPMLIRLSSMVQNYPCNPAMQHECAADGAPVVQGADIYQRSSISPFFAQV